MKVVSQNKKLIIYDIGVPVVSQDGGQCESLDWREFKRWIARNLFRCLWSYDQVILITPHPFLRPRPLFLSLVLWLVGRRFSALMDTEGNVTPVTALTVLHRVVTFFYEVLTLPFLLKSLRKEVAALSQWTTKREPVQLSTSGRIAYIKTDLWFSTAVGGSVSHVAGVVNNLGGDRQYSVEFFSTAPNSLIGKEIRNQEILPAPNFWDFRDVPALIFSSKAFHDVSAFYIENRPAFIYQRYSLNNYAAVLLAKHLRAPLVTEYNGSEVWIGRNWGVPVAYPQLSEQIEKLNLQASDLIVVVSTASRDELVSRGIDPSRILVNPNGVDVETFRPNIDQRPLRERLGLLGCRVIGFIGTFGPWHGTEELVLAFADLLQRFPRKYKNVNLLLIGDGARRHFAENLARELGVEDRCIFTGLVQQFDAAEYLACCDILVAPHVPNTDGTSFFGSPTKLFEYMAMGRPIVASRLGQIAEVLRHGETAWLVEPGNPHSLAAGFARLLDDGLLCKTLGESARAEAVSKHTWSVHAANIVRSLQEVCR